MKISYRWLQEHIAAPLPSPKELEQKIIFHAFEIESVQQEGNDTVFDIKVLPDRAGDCLSHAGVAREIAGLFNLSLKEKTIPVLPPPEATVPVELQNEWCQRYIAVRVDGVKVGPSPEWLKEKLESVGQRSINNIVDATNFVLLDSGQPVHAFDAAKIDGGIVVRLAHEGETIKLLGGEEKSLKEHDLVIADYLGTVAVAGVKGGASAEVTDATTSIIVEVASFDAVAVRKTSRRLNLITDASKRFENHFSPLFALPAAQQAAALIIELAGGTISAVTDENKSNIETRTISFSATDVSRVLGATIGAAQIEDVLARYRYTYTKEGEHDHGQYVLTVPHYRFDLTGAHDIAEEIGRVIGYDAIPAKPLPFAPITEKNVTDMHMSAMRAWAIQNGYREVCTYTFRPKGEVSVAYGAKGKDALRSTLSDGLKESYEQNRLNAPLLGIKEVKLFEIGTVFFADREELHVALCDKGTIQELALADMISEKNIDLSLASILPKAVPAPIAPFKAWSLYPFITRDIAMWVKSDADRARLSKLLDAFATTHHALYYLFDEFAKDGRTSVAYRFIFQAPDRTLTDTEVSAWFDGLLTVLKAENSFEIR